MHDWALGTDGKIVSMGVYSDGSYGIRAGLIYSFPVTCENGDWAIVQGIEQGEFSLGKMKATEDELIEEMSAVEHLLPSRGAEAEMAKDRLHEAPTTLHDELEGGASVSDADRDLLRQVADDVDRVLEEEGLGRKLKERAGELATSSRRSIRRSPACSARSWKRSPAWGSDPAWPSGPGVRHRRPPRARRPLRASRRAASARTSRSRPLDAIETVRDQLVPLADDLVEQLEADGDPDSARWFSAVRASSRGLARRRT